MLKRSTIIFFVFKNILLFKFKGVVFLENFRVRGNIKLSLSENSKLSIGKNFSMTSGFMLNPLGRNLKSMIRVDGNAVLKIGDNVGMSCVSIWAKEKISIGNDVKLGAGVIIMDSDMHSLDFNDRRIPSKDESAARKKEIIIGNDVFIGLNSIITKGVFIGDRSIIAAGSVVVNPIPSDEIWGGNPAQFIRKIKNKINE